MLFKKLCHFQQVHTPSCGLVGQANTGSSEWSIVFRDDFTSEVNFHINLFIILTIEEFTDLFYFLLECFILSVMLFLLYNCKEVERIFPKDESKDDLEKKEG